MASTSSSSSSSSSHEDHRLGTDLRLAFDSANSIIGALSSFPVDVHFIVFAVVDGEGSFVRPHKLTLRDTDPELLEQLHIAVWDEICSKITNTQSAVDFSIKNISMRIKQHAKQKETCQFCNAQVARLNRHMASCPHAQGHYCGNCQSFITRDYLEHVTSCRSRLYHCTGCGNDYLHASTLRAHQRHCSHFEEGVSFYMFIVCYFAILDISSVNSN